MEFENTHSDAECLGLLLKIRGGYSSFLNLIVPEGWRKSAFVEFFHPTAQQQYEEALIFIENLNKWHKSEKEEEPILLSDYSQDLSDVDEDKESLTLLGLCLWDIFSHNHSVVDEDGIEYDLGSFRGSAGFIAEFINEKVIDDSDWMNMDYMEFYMGTIWIDGRGNLQPFYEYIFSVLKKEKCDWKYSFPRMGLIRFQKEDTPALEDYDPGKAMEQEIEKTKVDDFQKELDHIYNEEFEEAKYNVPSPVVVAYKKIYGVFPDGHPQKVK